MRILITGASGLLGSRLNKVLSKDFEVIGTYNKNMNSENQVHLDITDKSSVDDLFDKIRPEIVIHSAALVDADYSEKNKDIACKIIFDGTSNILKACEKFKSKLIYISTDFVFDGNNGPYDEKSDINPLNFYGIMKGKGELIIQKRLKEYLIIRVPLLYGVDKGTKKSFVTEISNLLRRGEAIYLDNSLIKYPTLTDDVAKAIKKLIILKKKGIFHVSNDEGITKYVWAKKIAKSYDLPESKIFEGSSKGIAKRPKDVMMKSEKIKELIDKFTSVDEGLKLLEQSG